MKWIPDAVPAKISVVTSRPETKETKGVMYFTAQPAVSLEDLSYRPLGKTEPREVKFLLVGGSGFPMRLPAPMGKVVLETTGNYVALQPQAIYSMFGFATTKKDSELANALERVLGKLPTKGTIVYAWSDRKLEFIIYNQPVSASPEYKGTVTVVENVSEMTSRMNAILLGYYWATSAKFAKSESDREQLAGLAATVLPKQVVEQYIQPK